MKKIFLALICCFFVLSTLGCAKVGDASLESLPNTTEEKEETLNKTPPDITDEKETLNETPPDTTYEEETLNGSSPELVISVWDGVSVIPEDLGMENTLDNPAFFEVFRNTSKVPLNKLIAFCLIADGLSEGACDELYRRFIEDPNTVLVFLSFLGNQTYPLTGMGEVSIAEFICKQIAFADVVWHGSTATFDNIITAYPNYYPTGRINELLDVLEREHNSAIELNPSNG